MATAKKLPSGAYRALVYSHTDMVDGKKVRRYESFTSANKNEAEYLASEFKLKKKAYQKPANKTVYDAIDEYIRTKENVLSPSTTATYEKLKRNYFKSIMCIPLCKLTSNIVQNEINILAATLSAKTVISAYGFLCSVLNEFHPDLKLNVRLPQRKKYIPSIPSSQDIMQIMKCVKGEEIELPVLMALWLGMRMSEIRGLRWENVFDDYIIVKEAMVDAGGKAVLKGTKSFAGTRRISLPNYIKSLVESQQRTGQFVITLTGQTIYKRFIRMLEKNKIPHCRFHDLRHANASVMLRLNIPDKYAMERLGHAQASTLKTIYQHTMKDEADKIGNLVDEYFQNMQHDMQHAN